MKHIFLRAKHWQLFIPLFIIPFGFQFMLMGSVMPSAASIGDAPQMPDFETFIEAMQWVPSIIAISTFFHLGWIWSVASGLKEQVPLEANLKYGRFKLLFAIPTIYLIILTTALAYFISSVMLDLFAATIEPTDAEMISYLGIFASVFFLHLLAVICLFYCVWYAAKSIRSTELQRDVRGSELAGYFFLTWFLPVGIWFLQPVINKLSLSENHINETL